MTTQDKRVGLRVAGGLLLLMALGIIAKTGFLGTLAAAGACQNT